MARPIRLTLSEADADRVRMILAETAADEKAFADDDPRSAAEPRLEEPRSMLIAFIIVVVAGVALGALVGTLRPEWVDGIVSGILGLIRWIRGLVAGM